MAEIQITDSTPGAGMLLAAPQMARLRRALGDLRWSAGGGMLRPWNGTDPDDLFRWLEGYAEVLREASDEAEAVKRERDKYVDLIRGGQRLLTVLAGGKLPQ